MGLIGARFMVICPFDLFDPFDGNSGKNTINIVALVIEYMHR